MHTVKIISAYVHVLPKPHINVLHFFLNENEKRVVLYFEENEKAVVFIFLWLLIFFMKQKRGNAV